MGSLIDETGNRYGRTTVLRRGPSGKNGDARWWCECDCGNVFLVRGYALRTGHTRSCGCLATDVKRVLMEEWREQNPDWVEKNLELANEAHRLPEGEAAFNQLFGRYKYEASKRGLIFELSIDDFREITQQLCHYCGAEPEQVAGVGGRLNGVYCYNGLDRIDNRRGYILGNVVPCCAVCNFAKRDMPYDGFIEWLDKVTVHRSEYGD